MSISKGQQFAAVCDYLASRRETILLAWRKSDRADPEQTTSRSLTVGQFLDHIPQMLDAFEVKLRSHPLGAVNQAAEVEKTQEEVKHGLHRWQQGYRLKELINECGHLQLVLFDEVSRFAATHPAIEGDTLSEVNRQIITLVNDTIGESAGQYERMQQAEAAGRMEDLKRALASVNEIESRRAALIHQAVHDLRNDVAGVSNAAQLLSEKNVAAKERQEFATLLQQGVQGLNGMLQALVELARLEAGKERRKIATFDLAITIAELGALNQSLARERGLFLNLSGPSPLSVKGDADKVRRMLQNLLVNALKYTVTGGVTLSWGEERENWWVIVKDTGPGLLSGPGAPLMIGLQEATASAKESDEKSAATRGEASNVLAAPRNEFEPDRSPFQQPGEGIGISIVKRLCELLDASLEISSSAEAGTTFRVVFPSNHGRTS